MYVQYGVTCALLLYYLFGFNIQLPLLFCITFCMFRQTDNCCVCKRAEQRNCYHWRHGEDNLQGVAFPPADYILFHNETRLTDVVDGVKTISSASRNDAGKYVCVARNSLGNVSDIIFLSVNDVLQKPTTILTSTNIKGTYIFLVRFVVYILLVNFRLRLRVYSTNIYCFQFLNILSKQDIKIII